MTTQPDVLDQLTAQRNALERHRLELLRQLAHIENQLADLAADIRKTRAMLASTVPQ